MIKNKTVATLLVGVALAVGCSKEEKPSGIQIFEENMGGDAKVCVDVNNMLRNTWDVRSSGIFDYEQVRLAYGDASPWSNSVAVPICINDNGSYYVNPAYWDYDGYAFAPLLAANQAIGFYPNNVYTESNTEDKTVTFMLPSSTNIYYDRANGKIHVPFPMAAFGEAGCSSLMFKHLTGAAVFDVVNNTGYPFVLNRIQVQASTPHTGSPSAYLFGYTRYNFKTNSFTHLEKHTTGDRPWDYVMEEASIESLDDNNSYSATYSVKDMEQHQITLNAGESMKVMVILPAWADPIRYTFYVHYDATDHSDNKWEWKAISMIVARNTIYNLGTFSLTEPVPPQSKK